MKLFILLPAIAAVILAAPVKNPDPMGGRCNPNGTCTACTNCKYCGHCAKGGGTCSVCR